MTPGTSHEPGLQDAAARHHPGPGGFEAAAQDGPEAGCRRAAGRDRRRRVGDGRAPRRRARRGRADRGAALRVRYPPRSPGVGCRPPGLSAQDPHRPARPHPHPAPGRRPLRLHQARRERIRPVRRRAFLHLHLGRPRHGGGARPRRREAQRRVRDRRRRHVGRHGLRGHEQRRRPQRAPDRHPQRQRHVDRAARRRAFQLPRPHHLERHLPAPARHRQAAGQAPAQVLGAARGARRGVHPHLLDRRLAVRGAGVLLRRPHRRPQSAAPALGAAQRARRQERPDPGARGHPEGQGLSAGRGLRRQVSRRQQVQRRHRRAGDGEVERAELHQGVRPEPDRGGAQGRQDRGHHRGHAVRHRPRSVRRRVPAAHLRRGHRRAARGDVRGRAGLGGLQAVRGHLFHLPAARLRPGGARRGDPAPARALRHRPRRTGGGRRSRPMRAPSTWPISAACRASC